MANFPEVRLNLFGFSLSFVIGTVAASPPHKHRGTGGVMTRARTGVVIGLISVVFCWPAQAQPGSTAHSPRDCSVVLLQRNIDKANSREDVRRDWLATVTESNFEEVKRAAQGTAMYGPFFADASYEGFNTRRREYLSSQSEQSSRLEIEATLRSHLAPDAAQVWLDCMRASAAVPASGLLAWIQDEDPSSVTLKVSWQPSEGLGALTLTNSTTFIGIAQPRELSSGAKLDRGMHTLALKRESPENAIRGAITGTVGQGGRYSADFYLPPPPRPAPPAPACNPDAIPLPASSFVRGQNLQVVGATISADEPPGSIPEADYFFNVREGCVYRGLMIQYASVEVRHTQVLVNGENIHASALAAKTDSLTDFRQEVLLLPRNLKGGPLSVTIRRENVPNARNQLPLISKITLLP